LSYTLDSNGNTSNSIGEVAKLHSLGQERLISGSFRRRDIKEIILEESKDH
jgi:hypothetical protein